ncbi:MAG: hypothetical protein NTV89_15240, partial [Proteobacteria bacterium]|nr:hypothetical protein [Pseudomonadota bacterium]
EKGELHPLNPADRTFPFVSCNRTSPDFVQKGEPMTLKINIENGNSLPLSTRGGYNDTNGHPFLWRNDFPGINDAYRPSALLCSQRICIEAQGNRGRGITRGYCQTFYAL